MSPAVDNLYGVGVRNGVHEPHDGHIAAGHRLVDDLFGDVAALVAGVDDTEQRVPQVPGVEVVVRVERVDALQRHQERKSVVVVGFVALATRWGVRRGVTQWELGGVGPNGG